MRFSVLIFVFAAAGCANTGDEGMFIVNNTAPPIGTVCTLTGDPAQAFLAHGSIVANAPSGYLLTPLLKSRVDALAGHEDQRTIHVGGANIVLSRADTAGNLSQVATYTSLFSGSLDPLATANFAFELVPASQLAVTTNTELSADITAFGMLGNDMIEAEPFTYAVTVCTNCITINHGDCATAMPAVRTGDPCNVFQDGQVDCCMSATGLLCPGP
jgi:hypothetical protein